MPSLALFRSPVDARPLGAVASQLAESWVIDWGRSRRGAVRGRRARVWLVGLLLLVLASLQGFAYASPPDPSWVPGLYDDADYDDVVVLLLSAVGVLDITPPVLAPVGPPVVATLAHRLPSPPAAADLPPSLIRGPPSI